MKTKVIQQYYLNGELARRCHKTTDGKYLHGLYEAYHNDSSIFFIRYYNMNKAVKLLNIHGWKANLVHIVYYI